MATVRSTAYGGRQMVAPPVQEENRRPSASKDRHQAGTWGEPHAIKAWRDGMSMTSCIPPCDSCHCTMKPCHTHPSVSFKELCPHHILHARPMTRICMLKTPRLLNPWIIVTWHGGLPLMEHGVAHTLTPPAGVTTEEYEKTTPSVSRNGTRGGYALNLHSQVLRCKLIR
jgi:hypothetical protein